MKKTFLLVLLLCVSTVRAESGFYFINQSKEILLHVNDSKIVTLEVMSDRFLDLELLDSNRKSIILRTCEPDSLCRVMWLSRAREYYLNAIPWFDNASFSLDIYTENYTDANSKDAGNSIENSREITAGTFSGSLGYGYWDYAYIDDGADFYKIRTNIGDEIKVRLEPPFYCRFYLKLLDKDGNVIESAVAEGSGVELNTTSYQDAIYISVTADNNPCNDVFYGQYNLTVSLERKSILMLAIIGAISLAMFAFFMFLIFGRKPIRVEKIEEFKDIFNALKEVEKSLAVNEVVENLEMLRKKESKIFRENPFLRKYFSNKAKIADIVIETRPYLKGTEHIKTMYFGTISRFYRDNDVIEKLEKELEKAEKEKNSELALLLRSKIESLKKPLKFLPTDDFLKIEGKS